MKVCLSYLAIASLCFGLIAPDRVFAQTPTEPGQDPFALSPELLQYFQGINTTTPDYTGLFHGDNMKHEGIFTTPTTQLGGAAPITAPTQQVEEEFGPALIRVTSKYEPATNLTKDSIIKITVTLTNLGTVNSPAINLRATLQDNNAVLIPDPLDPTPDTGAPGSSIDPEATQPDTESGILTPTLPNPTPDTYDINNPEVGLTWSKLASGADIVIRPGNPNSFVWYVQPTQDDTVLRWTFVATAGSGQSTLLQWIPIKNPNPTGTLALNSANPGLSNICTQGGQSLPYPEGDSSAGVIQKIEQRWTIKLVNDNNNWTNPQYQGYLKFIWSALSSIECSSFLENVTKNGPLQFVAFSAADWWWGWQIDTNIIRFNLTTMTNNGALNSAPEQMNQFFIHELGHVFMSKNLSTYHTFENTICGQGSPTPRISVYGNTSCSEDFAEAIGYYAARAAHETGTGGTPNCASKNPYDRGQLTYYTFLKQNVFGNVDFGPIPNAASSSC